MATSTGLVAKDQTVCRVVTVIVLFVVLAGFNFDLVVDLPRIVTEFHEEWTSPNLPFSSREEWARPHQPISSTREGFPLHPSEILYKLKELSRLTSDGHDFPLNAAQKWAWHMQHPCASRSELPAMYAARKHVKDIPLNSVWERVLEEYSNLHRLCMKRVGNITDFFFTNPNGSIPGCKFLIGEGTNGLGNKLLVTVSAVLYVIATQRVLPLPLRTNLKTVLCEPFVGSSWILETDDIVPAYGNVNTSWVEDNVFIQKMNARLGLLTEETTGLNNTQASVAAPSPLVDALVVSSGWGSWEPRDWFFCNTEQKFLSAVPWVYMSGCLYSAPKIFGSPLFGAALRRVFPDNIMLTRLLRSTLLPGERVWTRFKRLNHGYFQHPDRRVAVQLRFFGDTHSTMSGLVNDRVLNCVLRNGILPNVTLSLETDKKPLSPAPITKMFIASLYPDLHDHLSEYYLRNPTESGGDVSLVQITNRLYQSVGVEEDTEALVEVLLLSVSDALLVTPGSTFGGLSHAYGGLTPWFINTVNSNPTADSCVRGQDIGNCQVGTSVDYQCPNDLPPSPEDVAEEEPDILVPCEIFGIGGGFQVRTKELAV